MADHGEWRVVVDLLRREASEVWGESTASGLSGASASADRLGMTGLDAGIFGLAVDAYNAAADRIRDLGADGAHEFGRIANALENNAAWYERTEADNESAWVHVDHGY